MKHLLLSATLIIAGNFMNKTYAQSLATTSESISTAKAITINSAEINWAFYADEDNKKYYIDFEKLHMYLDRIEVLNEKDEIIFTDNLWNLPADALYELDCSAYDKGRYFLRLKSLTDETLSLHIDVK